MLQGIPSLMVSRYSSGCADSDVLAFLAATGITDATISDALCTLVTSAKANGWWSLCYAIYPMVGGTSATCAVNLKSPGTYDITWHNSLTFASTGVLSDGSIGYGDTGIDANAVLSASSHHMSYYSRTDTSSASSEDIGCIDSIGLKTTRFTLGRTTGDAGFFDDGGQFDYFTDSTTNKAAFFMAMRNSSTVSDITIYRNTSTLSAGSFASGYSSASLPSLNIFICGTNLNGSINAVSTRECAFATVGDAMNGTIQSAMYNDIQTFNTTLGRQV